MLLFVASLYVGQVLSSGCFAAMHPLVFETLCEMSYPAPESVSNAVLTLQKDFWVLVFFLVLWIPGIGKIADYLAKWEAVDTISWLLKY